MAQLKDLIVTGATRLIGNAYTGSIQITTLNAPTSAGGTTYGPGTNGYVLKSNGSSVYWGSDNNAGGTVTSVRVQATSPITSSQNTAQTGTLNTTIALADGYGDTKNPYASKTKNYVLAASATANSAPSFRALVAADIPTLSITDKTSGTLTVARGGTNNTAFTANRLIYGESATKLSSAASLYATGSALAVNKTSITSGYNFEVSGKTYLNGMTLIKGLKGTSGTDYGEVLPDTAEEGQIFFQLSDVQYELPSGGTTGQFLRGDRIWSNTLTDSLNITKAGGCGVEVNNTQETNPNQVAFIVGESGNGGIFSRKHNKWIVYSDPSGDVVLNGNAATATYASYLPVPRNPNSTNPNTFTYGGGTFYVQEFGGASNTPDASWWLLETWHSPDARYGAQLALGMTDQQAVYYRQYSVESWKGWLRLWRQGDAVTGAVWNDYAEYRETKDCDDFGYVVFENGDDTLSKTTERLQHFAGITSDTWGFAQGQTDNAKTPIAVAGRVLVYPYQNRNNYKPGDCLCAAPGGTVDIMTREEVREWPDRIVGTVSCVPEYEEWGGGKLADRPSVKVNGRIWVKVR